MAHPADHSAPSWLDRAAQGLDRLLEPRPLLGLVTCIFGAHLLLGLLLGGVPGLPALFALFCDPSEAARLARAGEVPDDDVATIALPVLAALAAAFATLQIVSIRLTGLGQIGRAALLLAVLPIWLLHLTGPLNAAGALGIPWPSWTFVGFAIGLLLTTAVEGRLTR